MGKRSQSEIRVPRTTAQFVTALARILREHLKLVVKKHEHWTFWHVVDWDRYEKAIRPDDDAPVEDWYEFERITGYPEWQLSVYLGVGQVEIAGTDESKRWVNDKVDIRVHIEKRHWVTLGRDADYYHINIWLKYRDGSVRKAGFNFWERDGRIYEDKDQPSVPDSPPRKIAFWRGATSQDAT